MASSPKKCRRCRVPGKLRRLDLCWGCYFAPGVREQYESVSAMGNRGHGETLPRVKDAAEIERAIRPIRCPRFDGETAERQDIHPERLELLMLRVKYKLDTDLCHADRKPEDDDAATYTEDDDLFF